MLTTTEEDSTAPFESMNQDHSCNLRLNLCLHLYIEMIVKPNRFLDIPLELLPDAFKVLNRFDLLFGSILNTQDSCITELLLEYQRYFIDETQFRNFLGNRPFTYQIPSKWLTFRDAVKLYDSIRMCSDWFNRPQDMPETPYVGQDHITCLPVELLGPIFDNLCATQLLHCRQVSSRFNSYIESRKDFGKFEMASLGVRSRLRLHPMPGPMPKWSIEDAALLLNRIKHGLAHSDLSLEARFLCWRQMQAVYITCRLEQVDKILWPGHVMTEQSWLLNKQLLVLKIKSKTPEIVPRIVARIDQLKKRLKKRMLPGKARGSDEETSGE